MAAEQALTYAEYLDRWRVVHDLEHDRMRGGFIDRYYRLPYALARPIARTGASPHAVSLLGMLAAVSSMLFWARSGRWPLLAGLLILVAGLFDQIDGAVAVLQDRVTKFGAVWDSAVDRVSDIAILVGAALWLGDRGAWAGDTVPLVVAGVSLSFLEYVRARCQAVGHKSAQKVTPAERPVRVVLCALMAIAVGASPQDGAITIVSFGWVLACLCLLSAALLLIDAARRERQETPTTATSG